MLINNGADITLVAKFLGHSKIDETLNTYSHMFKNKLDNIINIIDNLNSKIVVIDNENILNQKIESLQTELNTRNKTIENLENVIQHLNEIIDNKKLEVQNLERDLMIYKPLKFHQKLGYKNRVWNDKD